MRQAKQRTVYDSFRLFDDENITAAREYLLESGIGEDDITDEDITRAIYRTDELDWDDARAELNAFLSRHPHGWLVTGTIGRWNGAFEGGAVVEDFDDVVRTALADCVYIRIWDEDGHLYITGAHHDGRNCLELKRLSARGRALVDDPYSDRSDADLHSAAWACNVYTSLPHFAHCCYGVPKRETA